MPQAKTTGGKGKKWTPPKSDQAFAEVDLNAKEDAIKRHADDDLGDEELPGSEDDDRLESEAPRERKFLDRSKTVQKRITRLERTFSQRMAESEARNQRQIAKLKAENKKLKLQRGGGDADEVAHNQKISALQAQLEEAIEKGETKTQARISVEISQLQGAFEAAKRAQLLGKDEDEEEEEEERPRSATDTSTGPTREARKFMRDNADWWDDDRFAIEKAAAIAIDNQLIEEGSDPNYNDHYQDLVERLLEKFPDMKGEIVLGDERRDRRRARDDDEEEDDDRDTRRDSRRDGDRRRTPAIQPFNREGQRGNQPVRRGRTVTITREQRENMVTFGLDPSNDDHVKEYAKSAEETNRSYRE